MVVSQELVKEIDSFVRDVSLVLRGNEPCPGFPRIPAMLLVTVECQHADRMHEPAKDLIILGVELDVVLL